MHPRAALNLLRACFPNVLWVNSRLFRSASMLGLKPVPPKQQNGVAKGTSSLGHVGAKMSNDGDPTPHAHLLQPSCPFGEGKKTFVCVRGGVRAPFAFWRPPSFRARGTETPNPDRDGPGRQNSEKVKIIFLESVRRGDSEKSSFAWYLVQKQPLLAHEKKFGAFGAKVYSHYSMCSVI